MSIAVDSGNNNAVVGSLVNIGVAAAWNVGFNAVGKFVTSSVPMLRPLGPFVPVVGVATSVIAGNAAGDAVTSQLNQGAVGTIQVGPYTIGIQARPGLTPPSGTLTFLPSANLAPYAQLMVNPFTGAPRLAFNSGPNLTYGANVPIGPNSYVVGYNDTIFTIAAKNGWSETALIARNPQLGPNLNIRAGQIINGLPPVSVNNSSLTVSTNTNPTAIQRTGSADLIGTANNVNNGILMNSGAKFVSMKPSDVGLSSTGVFGANFSSSLVTDGFRPGNFNISAGGVQGLRDFSLNQSYLNFLTGVSPIPQATFLNLSVSSSFRSVLPILLSWTSTAMG